MAKKCPIKPLGDRVVCEVLEAEEEKIGSIVVPDSAKEKPQQAEVLAVGSGKMVDGKLVALDVKEGDTVLYGKYSGSEVKIGADEYLILRESDIFGILNK